MFYLRKEPYEVKRPEFKKTDGTVVPEKTWKTDDRALYKLRRLPRFYRMSFMGLKAHPKGMVLYTCSTLKTILKMRLRLYEYCGEWFDVYDENGKVELPQMDASLPVKEE